MTDVERRPASRVASPRSPASPVRWFLATWGRLLLMVAVAFVQFAALVVTVAWVQGWAPTVFGLHVVTGTIAVLVIVNSRVETTYKLAWAIPVCLFPLMGALFYLLYGARGLSRRRRERIDAVTARATAALAMLPPVSPEPPPGPLERQAAYLRSAGGARVFDRTATAYYPVGELGFDAMLDAIAAARRYVFAEYFIIEGGQMWERLFSALAAKAAEGLDVRLMYDDLGSLFRRPLHLHERCEAAGIRVCAVNPLGVGFTMTLQNRDHRKILAVDGTVAITGGANIADEYINAVERFGHWKDTMVRLTGPGAWGLTVLFLKLWDVSTGEDTDHSSLAPSPVAALPPGPDAAASASPEPDTLLPASADAPGVVAPFDDSPFDTTSVGEQVYRHLMHAAERSVDIFTPYLIVSDSLVRELQATAQSGVRVRIVVPHRPDKWYVHLVTRSFYPVLLEAGVEVYEYTPGFIHAKSMLVDDAYGLVGTINFDFRSFFLHQECAVWMYGTSAVDELRADVDATIAASQPVTLEEMRNVGFVRRLGKAVLRTFAPAM